MYVMCTSSTSHYSTKQSPPKRRRLNPPVMVDLTQEEEEKAQNACPLAITHEMGEPLKNDPNRPKGGKKADGGKYKARIVDAKAVFLTYAQCEYTPTQVLAHIERVLKAQKLEEYIIAREDHEEEGHHIHAYIYCKAKKIRKPVWMFSIPDTTGALNHADVQGARSRQGVAAYCAKDGCYIESRPGLADSYMLGDTHICARLPDDIREHPLPLSKT